MTDDETMLSLRDYVDVVRRRRRLVLSVAAALALLAACAAPFMTAKAESSVKVLLRSPSEAATLEQSASASLGLATQQQLVTSVPVAETVARELNLPQSPESLRALINSVTVTQVPETSVIQITATHEDPLFASRIAEAFAKMFLASREREAEARVEAAADELERLIDAARTEIAAIEAELESSRRDAAFLRGERTAMLGDLRAYKSQLAQQEAADAQQSAGEIITPVTIPEEPELLPVVLRNALLGVLLGLVFGLLLAFVREWLEDPLVRDGDVERFTMRSSLGEVHLSTGDDVASESVWETSSTDRALRTTLGARLLEWGGDSQRHQVATTTAASVLITAADGASAEAAALIAAKLAVAYARAGERVVLLDFDPTQRGSELIVKPPVLGAFDAVEGAVVVSDVLAGTSLPSLSVVGPGAATTAARDHVTADRVLKLIEELPGPLDKVLIAGPPAISAEALELARAVHGVALVARWASTPRQALAAAAMRLRQVQAELLGTVVVLRAASPDQATLDESTALKPA